MSQTQKMAAGTIFAEQGSCRYNPSSWKMYDSIDYMVAFGFYGMYFITSKILTRITLYQFI